MQPFNALESTCPFYTTRQQARKDFQRQGLPTAKSEAYKYTPIARSLAAYLEDTQKPPVPITATETVNYQGLEGDAIILVNGQVLKKPAALEGCKQVKVLTFQEAHAQQNPAFLAHFAQHAKSNTDAFVALNTALFAGGLFIQVEDQAVVDKPLFLQHYTAPGTALPITHPRLLVVAGKQSQATIITNWKTADFTNAVAEVVLEEGAYMDYYTLQTELDRQHHQVNATHCWQAARSTLNTYTFTWSGALMRNNLHSVLAGPNTALNMYGLYALRGRQHVDNSTLVDHRAPNTYSNELYKGIMLEESTGVFNGRIHVQPEAQKTNAFQTNNNLVLSNDATLHTKPQLEIWADDVKCSHGATTGQLNEEQLFYLRARGISEETARYLLRQAFAGALIDKVPWAPLREALHTSLGNTDRRC
jgi:Fe-S cluster assembly protein SufD